MTHPGISLYIQAFHYIYLASHYIPGMALQTSSAGSGLQTLALLQVIRTGMTGRSPSSHCKVTVSPSVVPVGAITLTLGDNTG